MSFSVMPSSSIINHPNYDPVQGLKLSTLRIQNFRKSVRSKHPRPIPADADNGALLESMAKPGFRVKSLSYDERVQSALPDLQTSMSNEQLRNYETRDTADVKRTLFMIATDLYSHLKMSELWNQSCRDGNNDLLWFIHRVDLEKPTSPASNVRGVARRSRIHSETGNSIHKNESLHSIQSRRVASCRLADLEEFEDLYYMIWHKLLTVYQELQLRYQSRFLSVTDVVHLHGLTLQEEDAPVTVGNIVVLLQLWWDELTEPSLMATLDNHLRSRTVLPDFLPAHNLDSFGQRHASLVKAAVRRRPHTKAMQAPGLKDLSLLAPVTVIDQVYNKHGIMVEAEHRTRAEHQSMRDMRRTEMNFMLECETRREAGKFSQPEFVDPMELPCACSERCPCRDLCIVEPDEGCLCAMQTDFFTAYEADKIADHQLEEETGHAIGEHFLFGASTNEAAQLIVARAAFWGKPMGDEDADANLPITRRARDVEVQLKRMEYQYLSSTEKPLPPLPTPELRASATSDSEMENDAQPDTPCKPKYKRSAGAGMVKRRAIGAVKRFKASGERLPEGRFPSY